MLKFLLDENISRSTAHFLQSLGHDVKSIHDLQLTGTDDAAILRKAALTSRIVLTHDLDFGNLMVNPVYYSGVIILRIKDQTPQSTNDLLRQFLKKVDAKKLVKSLVIVSEDRYRLRELA